MAVMNVDKSYRGGHFDFAICDHLPFAIFVVDPFHHIVFFNRQAGLLFNLSAYNDSHFQEIENTLSSSLYYLEVSSQDENERQGISIKIDGQNYIYDLFPVLFSGKLRYKLVILKNRSSLPKLEQEMDSLKRENDVLKRIIDSSYDGIYITDQNGKTLYFNDAFARISGFKREETIGKKVQDLVASDYLPKSCAVEVIKHRKSVSMNIDYYNGVKGMLSGSPVFDENGKLIRTILNVRDMTELNRLDKELKNATALTASYRQQLKEVQLEYQWSCNFVAKSKAMRNVIDLGAKAAAVDSPVLIMGESGAGKDVVAKFIHNIGERAKKGDLIKINCGAIPETLLESVLFGYEPGAFTGAKDKGKVGLFELADGGTFFLDEIGDMPLNLQVKLLDVLQEGSIYRIGGTKPIPVNARIIAATNKNLEQMVKEEKFRLDLYYRLNVISIYVPPLRERPEDIIPLMKRFFEHFNEKYGVKKLISPQAIDCFLNYSWPGNIRELRNVVERVVVTTECKEIRVADLPEQFRNPNEGETLTINQVMQSDGFSLTPSPTLRQLTEQVEKQYIVETIAQTETLKEAAGVLGIDVSTLVRKKQKYKI